DTERVLQELEVGEALVSMLHNKGEPSIVQRTYIRPPLSRVGPLTAAERPALIAGDLDNLRKHRDGLASPSSRARLVARNSSLGEVTGELRRFGNVFGLAR